MEQSTALAESWILGVAANPAAPPDVLLRLLDQAGAPAWRVLCEQRSLPAELVAAVLAHPDRKVRGAFARNPFADPADRGLLARDQDPMVRMNLASGPRHPHLSPPKPLPDAALEMLLLQDGVHGNALFDAGEFQLALFLSQQVPHDFLHRLLHHENPALRVHSVRISLSLPDDERQVLLDDPDPGVRAAAWQPPLWEVEATRADIPEQDCHAGLDQLTNRPLSRDVIEDCFASRRNLTTLAGNRNTPPDIVARLARDPDPAVREQVAHRAGLAPTVSTELARDPDPKVRKQVAHRADLDPIVLTELSRDPDRKVRERVAGYPDLDPALLAELARDTEEDVRARALLRPRTNTKAQRRQIDQAADRTADKIGRPDEAADGLDADWLAACAVSEHPLMRRIAAINSSELPADLVARLIQDPDPHVRHLMAYNHPAAPAELLLEAFIAGPRQRRFLLALPAFPRTGLAGLLEHADPEVRALAAADTTLDEPPYRLVTDSDPRVQRAAAGNPLLSADWIRTLLTDPDFAEATAANPALTADQLHDLLDRAAVPRATTA